MMPSDMIVSLPISAAQNTVWTMQVPIGNYLDDSWVSVSTAVVALGSGVYVAMIVLGKVLAGSRDYVKKSK
jgi:hypothetical protein